MPTRPSRRIREVENPPNAPPSTGPGGYLFARGARHAWASGQLVFDVGSTESARNGFAGYALDGETAKELRSRVNRTILGDLEQKVLALRALHGKLRDLEGGENFGGLVARSRPA